MKNIIPFKTLEEANLALDNGGRFFNFLTTAQDGILTSAEVGKVAGLFMEKQKTILYLSMCVSGLTSAERKTLENSLSEELAIDYKNHIPRYFSPSEAKQKGRLGENVVITGIPKFIEYKEDFKGFVVVPIMAGKVMTMMLIPIIDQYDVYKVLDSNSSDTFLVAHAKSKKKLPQKKLSLGGVLKELKLKKEENAPADIFLEAVYFSETIKISDNK